MQAKLSFCSFSFMAGALSGGAGKVEPDVFVQLRIDTAEHLKKTSHRQNKSECNLLQNRFCIEHNRDVKTLALSRCTVLLH